MDLSNQPEFVATLKDGGRMPHLVYSWKNRRDRYPFPPNTHGFLYYHSDPTLPPLAGQLRLRLTSSNDPASFKEGKDLIRHDYRPWNRSLLCIVASKGLEAVKTQLLADGLVDPPLISQCERLVKDHAYERPSPITLYTLNQPFFVDLSHGGFRCRVVGEDALSLLHVQHMFQAGGKYNGHRRPYRGNDFHRFVKIIHVQL
jgi:hypothetical protein